MDSTPRLGLPYILEAQAQKHVTHNEALRALDALVQLGVVTRALPSPPATIEAGARYLVPAGATDAWSGRDNAVAVWNGASGATGQAEAWSFHAPTPGWLVYVADEAVLLVWSGTSWSAATGSGGAGGVPDALDVLQIGVNAAADTTNRLSVRAPATLLSHDGDDHRAVINKAAPADTASLVFQTGFSGRAEMGTAGTDGFAIKTSADGAVWRDALVIDPATGAVTLPHTPAGPVSGGGVQRFIATHEEPNGASGGTFQGGTWVTRTLNTVKLDSVGVMLANSVMSLPAGTYAVNAHAMAYACGASMVRLRDVTNAVTLVSGLSSTVGTTDPSPMPVSLHGGFTLAAPADIELQHVCKTTSNYYGLGSNTTAAQGAEPECFVTVMLDKLS